MNQHPSSMSHMHGDAYSKSGSRTLPRSMDQEKRRMSNKDRHMRGDYNDMDSSRPSLSGHMYSASMYGGMPQGNMSSGMHDSLPQGMYPGMYGGMSKHGMPRMMDYPGEMPRRYMDRQERPMDMMYGRYMDMFPGRYMSSQDRLMHIMNTRHLYAQKMNQGRMGETMSGNMESMGNMGNMGNMGAMGNMGNMGNMGGMDARGRNMENYN